MTTTMGSRSIRLRAAPVLVAVVLALGAAGCASHNSTRAALNRPVVVFCEPITEEDLATVSTTFVERAHVAAAKRTRSWEQMTCYQAMPAVQHEPLWWEDPFEDKDKVSGDGYTGWTWEDWLAIVYSDARWMLNTMLSPASMAVTPIWTPMRSDGVLSKQLLGFDHDAERNQRVPEPYDLRKPRPQQADQ